MRITEYTGATVLAVDYQKPPECNWPKPVEDCLDVYKWALGEGYDPAKIFFAGDSAGGGLVVSVMALAREKDYPMPAGGLSTRLCLCLCISLSVSGYVFASVSVSVSVSQLVCVWLCICVCVCVCVAASVSACLCLAMCLCL